MYQLFIANKNYSSWSLRPWVLMREQSIEFEEKFFVFEPGSNWLAFRKFSPNGRVPCLKHGDVTVWDSLAIVEYLAERHAGIWPKEAIARTWARCAAAEMHSAFGALRERCSMSCGIRVRLHEMPAAFLQDIARIDELWSEGLQRFGGPFLAGAEFTAVDAFFAPVAFRVQTYGLSLSAPASGYAARLLGLTAMRDWYSAALQEKYRDLAHEEDTRKVGTWTADYRTS